MLDVYFLLSCNRLIGATVPADLLPVKVLRLLVDKMLAPTQDKPMFGIGGQDVRRGVGYATDSSGCGGINLGGVGGGDVPRK